MGWDLNSGQTIGGTKDEPVCYWSDCVKIRARGNLNQPVAEMKLSSHGGHREGALVGDGFGVWEQTGAREMASGVHLGAGNTMEVTRRPERNHGRRN
jgi:hypothetical protein